MLEEMMHCLVVLLVSDVLWCVVYCLWFFFLCIGFFCLFWEIFNILLSFSFLKALHANGNWYSTTSTSSSYQLNLKRKKKICLLYFRYFHVCFLKRKKLLYFNISCFNFIVCFTFFLFLKKSNIYLFIFYIFFFIHEQKT